MRRMLKSRKVLGLLAIALVLSATLVSFETSNTPTASANWGCGGSYIPWPAPSSTFVTLVQSGEDLIKYREEPNGNPNLLQIVLTSGKGYPDQNVTWWKGAELYDETDFYNTFMMSSASTQDGNHGPSYAAVTQQPNRTYCLTLAKAKLFGIHMPMYEFYLSSKFGKTIYLHWARDTQI